jgi:hypothetical protein
MLRKRRMPYVLGKPLVMLDLSAVVNPRIPSF